MSCYLCKVDELMEGLKPSAAYLLALIEASESAHLDEVKPDLCELHKASYETLKKADWS